jgi:1,4-dihydroxy-2-naphthoate octaprenyltransferase
MLGRWVLASRPGFLAVTLVAACLGIAQSQADGCAWDGLAAVATVLLALMTHAAVNLYNDYGDAVGGSDAVNTERLFPFSGGSRVIQDGVFSARQMRDVAFCLGLVVMVGGLWLVGRSGPGLLLIGAAGLLLGWAYSSPQVGLMSRGWGELSVAGGWWLIVVGADEVQRHALNSQAALAGVSMALLVAAVLWAAEFPDARADAAVGKRTLVVRLGPQPAAGFYAALVLLAHTWVAACYWWGVLPAVAGWALGSAPLSAVAAWWLWRHAAQPARLRPAIALSIAAAIVHGLLFTAALAGIALRP